ncbi:cellulose synthase operon protein YhjQ [Photobacterium sp. SDRW27]|uniref:cellulose biosynthesis protein BcsQ n=1 Tax=Photobacterium obscurum TaxID=2829490 RepID=UPI0022438EAB|nr:cellulose biosynthesis protein BcsQ [Photobacterium obscurum]MCW8329961.1 cellulose synthase operon protein YhjQ [Photobacterium obscurum]
MKLIAISGLKGGVGAASVAANLTCAFHGLNKKVVIVDLDLRNFIRVHFSMAMSDRDGWAVRVNQSEDWALAFHKSPVGVPFLPFGELALTQAAVECNDSPQTEYFADHRAVFKLSDGVFPEMLATLGAHYDYIIIHLPAVTFSAGFRELLHTLHAVVDMQIMVVNPDTACNSILGSKGEVLRSLPKLNLLSNKFYLNSEVSTDFSFYMKKEWQDLLISNPLHFDEAVAEATASLQTVGCYSPHSQASSEYKSLALWCIATLSRAEND